MSHLSRKEIDEVKSAIDKAVYKLLGANDSSVLRTAIDCVSSGYDRRKTSDKLSVYLDSKKASRLSEKIFDILDDVKHKSRKRHRDDSRERDRDRERDSSKKTKTSYSRNYDEKEDRSDSEKKLSSSKIKEMMANAQKEIEERKRTLDAPKNNIVNTNVPIPTPSIYGIPMGLMNRGDADKARKIAQLQAQIKNKLSSGILANTVIQIPVAPDKPTPLILDDEGRTIDKSGKAVQLTHVAPTLKANIRAKKREQFRSHQGEKITEESAETKFYDSRIGAKPPLRNKRALRFHEPGKFVQLAERQRMRVYYFSFVIKLSIFKIICILLIAKRLIGYFEKCPTK